MKKDTGTTGKTTVHFEGGDPGTILIIVYLAAIVFFVLLGSFSQAGEARAQSDWQKVRMDDVAGGELLVRSGDGDLYARTPLLHQQVDITIHGMIAETVLRQRFKNDSDQWLEAVYVFPLPEESGVTHMRMRVGDRVIIGRIKEKNDARKTYLKAREEGRKTSLLAQKRPNIFSMAVANIPPAGEIEVEIGYQDTVRLDGGTFSYRFPMVVAPRYIPGSAIDQGEQPLSFDEGGWAVTTDMVPDAPEITPPVMADGEERIHPVELSLTLKAGFPVRDLSSLYHGVEIDKEDAQFYRLRFDGRVYADRDFVIEYRAANTDRVAAALFTENRGDDRYGYLLVNPPVKALQSPLPRELVFVIDVSGSMAGASIRQAKTALAHAIEGLAPRDSFDIIAFNSTAWNLFDRVLEATDGNKDKALRGLRRLRADGGTEIAAALERALGDSDGSSNRSRLRQIVFLTDGAVGNERALFTMIAKRLGDARLFTVGIGSAPNSYFMTRAAAAGRGSYCHIGRIEEVETKMAALFEKLAKPVMTNLELVATDGSAMEIYPHPLPDLYHGEPVVAVFKGRRPVGTLDLRGSILGRPWSTQIEVAAGAQRSDSGVGIATLWARKKIRSLMDGLHQGAVEEAVRRQVTETALEHHLVSRYTSLVAVEEQVARPEAEELSRAQMKTNLPQGWQYPKVFGTAAQTGTRSRLVLAVGFLLVAAGVLMVRRGRPKTMQVRVP